MDMAKSGMVPVSKMQEEGQRATQKLEIVYIMNLVDDYMSENWSILLQKKGNALMYLKAWQTAQENKIQGKLGMYHTKHNGELEAHKMEA
ncbi:hypothetical protein C0995_011943 [Termitomyces sp. Mi166|nr:hypothetical protein C0995_011943 [Termitomyces sp. Mi166\